MIVIQASVKRVTRLPKELWKTSPTLLRWSLTENYDPIDDCHSVAVVITGFWKTSKSASGYSGNEHALRACRQIVNNNRYMNQKRPYGNNWKNFQQRDKKDNTINTLQFGKNTGAIKTHVLKALKHAGVETAKTKAVLSKDDHIINLTVATKV